jgi:hypothetical protein
MAGKILRTARSSHGSQEDLGSKNSTKYELIWKYRESMAGKILRTARS